MDISLPFTVKSSSRNCSTSLSSGFGICINYSCDACWGVNDCFILVWTLGYFYVYVKGLNKSYCFSNSYYVVKGCSCPSLISLLILENPRFDGVIIYCSASIRSCLICCLIFFRYSQCFLILSSSSFGSGCGGNGGVGDIYNLGIAFFKVFCDLDGINSFYDL